MLKLSTSASIGESMYRLERGQRIPHTLFRRVQCVHAVRELDVASR